MPLSDIRLHLLTITLVLTFLGIQPALLAVEKGERLSTAADEQASEGVVGSRGQTESVTSSNLDIPPAYKLHMLVGPNGDESSAVDIILP